MKVLTDKAITDVPGILASAVACGIKKNGNKDLCMIYSKYKACAAAVFTTNKVKGAPLIIDMENIKNENTQAIVMNSGNANSCTGKEGLDNAYKMLKAAAEALGLSQDEVLIQSTGQLAVQLPVIELVKGINKAASVLSQNGGADAAEAILTTDRRVKKITVEFEIGEKKIIISGIAKGSTMIHPNMATMTAIIVTNINITKAMLNKAFKESIKKAYNMISVDGDTSTNDMAVILANGEAGNALIERADESYEIFLEALDYVNIEIAKMIASDGEGSTKLIEIQVEHARSVEDARKCARAVAASSLVKCGMYGSHPAFPDIACAMGYSEANFNPDDFDISIQSERGELTLMKNSVKKDFDEAAAKDILSEKFVRVVVDLKDGDSSAAAWGCDLGPDYVKANAYVKT